MAQEVRSSQSGTASFDFSSQAGVLAILKAVRASDASVSDKNELRDLVFLFANGRGDQAVRNVLEERLAALGITGGGVAPAAPSPATPAAVQTGPGFAGSRPTPAFSVSAANPAPAPATATPTPSAPQPAAPPATATTPDPAPAPSTPAQPAPAPAAVITPITPTRPAASVPPAPAATPTPVAPAASAAPAPAAAPSSPAAAASAPAPAPAPSTDTKAVLDRIKMIKAEVNSRFGNPVNLVDINNAVGREYMSALLEAMKQVSTDSPIMIAESMERLETVYAQIQKIEPDQVAPTPIPATSPAVSAPAPSIPTQAAQVASITPTSNPVVPVPATPVTPEPPAPASEWSAPESAPAVPDPAANRIEVRPMINVSPVAATPATPVAAPAPVAAVPTPVSSVAPLASVAASPALHSPDELPDPASLKTASVAGDPLFTKEVDDGLDQLLSEWSLFKKSGLFGTGPKGREHPLFKKLAPLQIPLVLAGRFEGSTQEIKQSITDYMNGWRYEQGIIYEKGETFEKYLRRVIKHIIDWQNNKARS